MKRGADGYFRQAITQVARETPKNAERIAKKNLEKQICLNCTKAECSGTRECFRRMEVRMT